ncbi:helix-turn-helix domain-containing protein [Mangrovicoccus sp. HB161399]|uniref:AraC-like ligand-binding domain-containing protein n=1 Tax=Mangrovicoccus sp. HB161399 TaxID=2720392 RepID=UPI001556D422|nr:helix-turn-helix domain-containing protein [Mangrovicoccus sp. HB161399]
MPSWNADRLPQKDRFPYWREVLCQNYTSLQPISEQNNGFRGMVRSAPLSELNVTTIASGRQKIYRRRQEIRKDCDAVCFLNLQLRGQSRMVQFGREALLQPGDFSLVDSTEPYLVDYCSDDWEQHSFRIPGALLGTVLGGTERRMAIRYGAESPLNSVAVSFLCSVAKLAEDLSSADIALSNQIVNLVGLALESPSGDVAGSEGDLRECLAQSILDYISANAQDPDMTPSKAAQRFRISVRYVHKVLEGRGTTFGKSLLDRRLELCAESLLRDPSAPIGSIAFHWGFGDLSHFSRSFRAKYGMTPTEYRVEGLKNPGASPE